MSSTGASALISTPTAVPSTDATGTDANNNPNVNNKIKSSTSSIPTLIPLSHHRCQEYLKAAVADFESLLTQAASKRDSAERFRRKYAESDPEGKLIPSNRMPKSLQLHLKKDVHLPMFEDSEKKSFRIATYDKLKTITNTFNQAVLTAIVEDQEGVVAHYNSLTNTTTFVQQRTDKFHEFLQSYASQQKKQFPESNAIRVAAAATASSSSASASAVNTATDQRIEASLKEYHDELTRRVDKCATNFIIRRIDQAEAAKSSQLVERAAEEQVFPAENAEKTIARVVDKKLRERQQQNNSSRKRHASPQHVSFSASDSQTGDVDMNGDGEPEGSSSQMSSQELFEKQYPPTQRRPFGWYASDAPHSHSFSHSSHSSASSSSAAAATAASNLNQTGGGPQNANKRAKQYHRPHNAQRQNNQRPGNAGNSRITNQTRRQ